MGLITTLKRWFNMIFKKQAEEDFNIQAAEFPEMESLINRCANIYRGAPEWLDDEDNIKTINFAKTVCSETARLTTLAIGIQIGGSARATWLQKQINKVYFQIRHWVEYGCAYGTVFIKPNGESLDVFTPADVMIVDYDNQEIKGIIFKDSYTVGRKYYTRLEYHRFVETTVDGVTTYPYYVSNRAYVSKSPQSIGNKIDLKQTKWADLMADTPPILKANGEKLDGPLFGVLRTPQANNVDISTPLGLPVFAEGIEELGDIDVAYSRNAGEIKDSQKIALLDDRLLMPSGTPVSAMSPRGMENRRNEMKLPHYVKNVFGQDEKEFYQEINPQLNTDARLAGINALLSQLSYKCGFSSGYFVFNEKTGMVTATQVEADDRRTIQFIKDVRDKLEDCLNGVIYALNVFADLYDLTPVGVYETTYDFGDITYNREEDRARWWQYVVQGKVPAWLFFVKFEGMTEEDAKAMVKEAQPDEPTLFGEE
jgi:A118 family predicted phage portal protein|nr:MAG TPA: portal protein [Caudoviricetes sp.]